MTADENPLDRVVARALQNEAFRERVVAEPRATLAAERVTLPEGATVKGIEDTANVWHLVLPVRAGALTEAELETVAAGDPLAGCSSSSLATSPVTCHTSTVTDPLPTPTFTPTVTPRPAPTALPG